MTMRQYDTSDRLTPELVVRRRFGTVRLAVVGLAAALLLGPALASHADTVGSAVGTGGSFTMAGGTGTTIGSGGTMIHGGQLGTTVATGGSFAGWGGSGSTIGTGGSFAGSGGAGTTIATGGSAVHGGQVGTTVATGGSHVGTERAAMRRDQRRERGKSRHRGYRD
jgi:hypothetical protein